MKAVVSKADLVSIISKIQTVISSKPAIPILANVLIEAVDDQLILSATDLTISMKCFTEAKVVEEGSIALPAKKFFQLVRELTSAQVKISKQGNDIAEIISGSSVFKINGMPKNEFPSMPESSGNAQISFSSSILKEMLFRTVFSAARDDSRYVLNGVYLSISNSQAKFIATDGKRLAKLNTEIELDPSFQGSYILPLKAVDEMIKMLDEPAERSLLTLTPEKVFLECGNLVLSTKLLTGQYPDVERVIPEIMSDSLILHREELIALLRQVSLFISETSSSVRFIFSTGQLSLSANSSNIGEGLVNMPVDYKGSKMEIAFNPFFFLDILRHSKDETVNFAISDSYNPGVITDSSKALYVIMPMRLENLPENPSPEEMNDSKDPAFA
jgi:DNA polymerase III subunit beta